MEARRLRWWVSLMLGAGSILSLVSAPQDLKAWFAALVRAWQYVHARSWLAVGLAVLFAGAAMAWWIYWTKRIDAEEEQAKLDEERARREAQDGHLRAAEEASRRACEVWSEAGPILRSDSASEERWKTVSAAVLEIVEPMESLVGPRRISYERVHAVLSDRLRAKDAFSVSHAFGILKTLRRR